MNAPCTKCTVCPLALTVMFIMLTSWVLKKTNKHVCYLCVYTYVCMWVHHTRCLMLSAQHILCMAVMLTKSAILNDTFCQCCQRDVARGCNYGQTFSCDDRLVYYLVIWTVTSPTLYMKVENSCPFISLYFFLMDEAFSLLKSLSLNIATLLQMIKDC